MFARALSAAAAAGALACTALPAAAVTAGPSCGEQVAKADSGAAIRILFAKNGTVQRYEVISTQQNTEAENDLRLQLERAYGQAGVNAPPLKIVSFKPSSGGLMMPDKAVDSCGRKSSFY